MSINARDVRANVSIFDGYNLMFDLQTHCRSTVFKHSNGHFCEVWDKRQGQVHQYNRMPNQSLGRTLDKKIPKIMSPEPCRRDSRKNGTNGMGCVGLVMGTHVNFHQRFFVSAPLLMRPWRQSSVSTVAPPHPSIVGLCS
jgi:hypothetical protein